jgi:hypothetical protein
VLAYHPQRWTVQDGTVFPLLRRVPIEPGVNNTTKSKDGTLKWRGMAATLQDRGWTIIPHRAGPGGQSYLRKTRVRRGYAHIEVFETAYPGRTTVEVDHEARVAWIAELFAAKVLPAPRGEPIRTLREKEVTALQDSLTRSADHAKFRSVADVHQANIEAIDDYLEKLEAQHTTRAESEPVALD